VSEIAISGLPLDYPLSGTAVYLSNLCRWLPVVAPYIDFRLFVRRSDEEFPGISTERVSSPAAALGRGSSVVAQVDKLLWEVAAFPAASLKRGADLLHSPTFAAPVLSSAPLVVTIHDLIPLVLPGYHRSRQSILYSALMRQTCQRAAAIITVSEHSKRDIVRSLQVPEDRVHVTYEAADERFRPEADAEEPERMREAYGLPERYVLYLGGAERRKNLETLVRAWAGAKSVRRDGVKLVLVADFPQPDRLYPDIPRLINELSLQADVVVLGQVNEADKPAIYRGATGFCFPSSYEGFGLPVIEAMASGVPVLASNATSLPEISGDAALLLPVEDVDSWTEAIERICGSDAEQERLRVAGLKRAGQFSWRQTAAETVTIYRTLLSR
jgi:glycosyltransferase involved in cell wall biosynthesis